MTDIKIDTADIVKRATALAQQEIERGITNAASSVASSLLASGKYYPNREGTAYEIIRQRVEEYVLSEAFLTKIDAIIETSAEEEMTRAVRALLNSKTRKHLFQPTSPVAAERTPPKLPQWAIRHIHRPEEHWDMDVGWMEGTDFDLFDETEKARYRLPTGGEWVEVSL